MRLFFAVSLFLLPLLSLAVPTGLNIMPTAEKLGIASARLQYETKESGKLYVPTSSTLIGSQFGLPLGLEGGIDQVSDIGTVYNLKWTLKDEGIVLPAFAVGAQNISHDTNTQYYVVATKSLVPKGIAKLHAGLLRDTNGDTITMLGASSTLGPLTLKADSVHGGTRDATSISAGITMKSITVTGIRYFKKNGPNNNTLMLSYEYQSF